MALTKKIQIDEQDVIFRASAAIPRIYRLKFGRDIFKDLMELEKSMKKNDEDKSNLDIGSLELFENIAYVMAKHLSLIHISEPTRLHKVSRMPSSA